MLKTLLHLSILCVTSSLCPTVTASNILVMLPNCMYSHVNNFFPIVRELASRGHNVTVVSAFPQKTPVPNLTDIVIPNFADEIFRKTFDKSPTKNLLKLDGWFFRLLGMWMFGLEGTKIAFQDETIKRFIEDKDSKFDLIIVETWFVQEPYVAFGHKFKAPVINFMPSFLFPRAAHLTGNHFPCSYVPVAMFGAANDHMTFYQRAKNCFYYVWDVYVGEVFYLKQQDALMREYFKYPGSENLPPLTEMLRNTALTLADYNLALGYPMPTHKNIIEFSGLNIKKPEKLPDELQKFLDGAKIGVIYFSFGSHAELSYLKPEAQEAIFKVLGSLKLKVIMKVEDSNQFKHLANENILIKSWFPQPSIIAHPKCKVFITHGGLHGTMEAMYNAVPVIVIPLFGDQLMNAEFVKATGIGYFLKHDDIEESTFSHAIHQVLHNSFYKDNMKRRSAIFKDTPINSLDNAIYWIEYVIRHGGASHLRPAVLDLYWYQELMLDVIALYLLIILLIVAVFIFFIRLIWNCIKYVIFCGGSNSESKKKKKQ